MENNLNKKQKAITDVPVAATCIIIVAVFVALVCIFQEATLDIVGNIFNAVIAVAAEPILWFVLLLIPKKRRNGRLPTPSSTGDSAVNRFSLWQPFRWHMDIM